MTRQLDIEQLLDIWLDEGPTDTADVVFGAAVARVYRQRQRPAWRLLWKEAPMSRPVLYFAGAAAAVLVAAAGLAILARPSGPSIGGDPSLSEFATPSFAIASPSLLGPDFDPRHPAPVPLTAGTHSSSSLRPTVSFELASDWVHYGDYPQMLMLSPDTETNRTLEAAGKVPSYIVISSGPLDVVPDIPLAGPPGDETACAWAKGGPAPSPGLAVTLDAAGFVEYLASQEGFAKTGPEPVTVGGLMGQQITLDPRTGWTTCLPATMFDPVRAQGERYRYVALDHSGGSTFSILVFAPSDFDAFALEAMPVVQSFEFDLSN